MTQSRIFTPVFNSRRTAAFVEWLRLANTADIHEIARERDRAAGATFVYRSPIDQRLSTLRRQFCKRVAGVNQTPS